jgi:hypothetical protein
MREAFQGFYAPTAEEYTRLWAEALVVVDTNVLLSFYRLPKTARDDFLSVLSDLKERIWIPYQVALEFQRSRLTVIANERRVTEAALQASGGLVDQVKEKVAALQIDKHDLGLASEPLLTDLENANLKLVEAIKAVHSAQLEITASDPIREQIDQIIELRVGEGPKNQDELDKLTKDGEARYAAKIPPGFADAEKDKNPNISTYVHDGVVYQRKFGDLILWRQLVDHCKKKKIKTAMFVTSDKKDDWWWREQGKTMGPDPELVREINREAGVTLFWMYSSAQFLENAKTYRQADVSDKSVAELKSPRIISSFVRRRQEEDASLQYLERPMQYRTYQSRTKLESRMAEMAVKEWLFQTSSGEVISQDAFPDLLSIREDEITGYEVKFTKSPAKFFETASAVGALSRGYVELNEEHLSEFYLVVVIDRQAFFQLVEDLGPDFLSRRATTALLEYPVTGIIIGFVREGGEFEVVLRHQR